MTPADLTAQLRAVKDSTTAFANLGRLEEYGLVAAERIALMLVGQARSSGIGDAEIAAAAAPLLQTFISIAENVVLPLSDETEDLVRQLGSAGLSLQESRPRPASRPLSKAPTGPTEFTVFVDESGTASFDEESQPVLCLVGVIVRDDTIPEFTSATERLLESYGLPPDLEIHASHFLALSPNGPLGSLSLDHRYGLLRDFLSMGLQRAAGLHHMSMLKSMVKPERRRRMAAQGMNAYGHTVVWFVLTLDRACLLVTMPARYKYVYDRTDAYRKDIGRIFRTLDGNPNKRLRLLGLKGPPTMLESHQSRFIQLADVAGYYLNRYRQFEVPVFKHRQELDKHETKIREMYGLIRPKLVDFIGKDLPLTVDWKALENFSLNAPQSTAAKPAWRPPVKHRRR